MLVIDHRTLPVADAIHPGALTILDATLAEVCTGRWTRSARYRERYTRLAERYRCWLEGVHTDDARLATATAWAIAVLGPCTDDRQCCVREGRRRADCWRSDRCGCKVGRHPRHDGPWTVATQLEADLQVAAVLAPR